MLNNNFQIITEGKIKVIGEWREPLANYKQYAESFVANKITDAAEYKDAFNISREIVKQQDKVKKFIALFDTPEIVEIKTFLNEINKILASKNTSVKKQIEAYKHKEKDLIIENGFANIVEQEHFKADFEVYKNECLLQFKGKTLGENMQDIALKIAEYYSANLLKLEAEYNKKELERKTIVHSTYFDIDKFQWNNIKRELASKKFTTDLSKQKQSEILEIIERIFK